jgi:sugar fermentation stimulation protein A
MEKEIGTKSFGNMNNGSPGVPLYAIPDVLCCRIVERVNRFVVRIEIGGKIKRAHINNTGRLQEIIVKNRRGFCFRTPHTKKTGYRLFAMEEKKLGALIDTQLQMRAFEVACQKKLVPWLKHCDLLRRNAKLKDSLIDYLFRCKGKPVYLEVKSAVLRRGRDAMYPDCPSLRGRRHVNDLIDWARRGGMAFVLFMAALPQAAAFRPNRLADAELSDLLTEAEKSGIGIKAIGLYFDPNDFCLYLYDPDLDVVLSSQ